MRRKVISALLATATLSAAMAFGASSAFAYVAPDWSAPTTSASVGTYATTYGVRAGSAGADFLGICNTNYDFIKDATNVSYNPSLTPATGLYSQSAAVSTSLMNNELGFGIWASEYNENPNPFYWNLYKTADTSATGSATTHWRNNDGTSWGDTSTAFNSDYGVVYGLEYRPDIIFGANQAKNWGASLADTSYPTYISRINGGIYTEDGTYSQTAYNSYHKSGDDTYVPTAVNNDATNIWTQVYTMRVLASSVDSITAKTVRYNSNSATASALAYEKAIRGNLLYVASQVDAYETDVQNNVPVANRHGVKRKTVAYLYAIDGTNNVAYFFTPQANGLKEGTDTGCGIKDSENESTASNPNTCYASNNGTIDLGYMATLPFVTTTFDSGVDSTITMKVEDIWKANPVCTVSGTTGTELSNVDIIIYNTSTALTEAGTSGGKNSSGVWNTGSFSGGLTAYNVYNWASSHGFTGTCIGGDDFGTSSNQSNASVNNSDAASTCPLLYCKRNYTPDKNVRAAYMYAQVYPEIYTDKWESLAYWVDKVYHIKGAGDYEAGDPNAVDYVTDVMKHMTQSTSVSTSYTASDMETKFTTGKNWWTNTGSSKAGWQEYAYYTGSSRSSWYDGLQDSEEPSSGSSRVGIFAPSSIWN